MFLVGEDYEIYGVEERQLENGGVVLNLIFVVIVYEVQGVYEGCCEYLDSKNGVDFVDELVVDFEGSFGNGIFELEKCCQVKLLIQSKCRSMFILKLLGMLFLLL